MPDMNILDTVTSATKAAPIISEKAQLLAERVAQKRHEHATFQDDADTKKSFLDKVLEHSKMLAELLDDERALNMELREANPELVIQLDKKQRGFVKQIEQGDILYKAKEALIKEASETLGIDYHEPHTSAHLSAAR